MRKLNVHQAFLGFFLGLALVSLAEQTYIFLQVVSAAAFRLGYVSSYIFLWLYGFDVPSFFGVFHVNGAYPALIVVAVCIIGLKLCASTPRAYNVVSAGEF